MRVQQDQKSQKNDVSLVEWLKARAKSFEKDGQHKQAIEVWQRLLDHLTKRAHLAPAADVTDLAAIHYRLGLNHRALRDNFKTLYHLKYSIRLNSQEPRYYQAFGKAFIQGGQWDVARAQFERAVRLDPRNPSYLRQYASLLLAMGRRDEARLYARKAVAAAPESVSSLKCLARVYFQSRMYSHAMAVLKKAKIQGAPGMERLIDQCEKRLLASFEGQVLRNLRTFMRLDGQPFHLRHYRWAESFWLAYSACEGSRFRTSRPREIAASLSWLALWEGAGIPENFFWEDHLQRFCVDSLSVWPWLKKFQDFLRVGRYNFQQST